MDANGFDELDRQLAHALQVDGRVPFSLVGSVLGVSDKTVARHYARLRAARAVRVVADCSIYTTGRTAWALRIRCTPGLAESIAEALARRPDTGYIALTSGGADVVGVVQNFDEAETTALLGALRKTSGVQAVTGHRLLHGFASELHTFMPKHGPLTADQIRALRPDDVVPPPGVTLSNEGIAAVTLTAQDQRLLAALSLDGRRDFEALATELGWSASTVRRRVNQLRTARILRFGLELDWRMFGLNTRAALWLSVPPAELAATGRALSEHPQISGVSATTGPANLFGAVLVADDQALYGYLTGPLAALPGISQIESAPIVRIVKMSPNTL
ncbi:AsnC family transcriptional regulator [Nocardia sp. NPDC050712]|uniref:AsnC family transcriptional regulator n=1 Tax=Nocardia sp. NPDC050712 TaxID=3155518 RepID=UPI0033FD8568